MHSIIASNASSVNDP